MRNSGVLIHTSAPLNTGKLISSYYLEIEYLLERVEGANTHYQTLGVERSANNEDVIQAYQATVAILHPSYHKVRAAVPDEMLVRVDQAFKKVSQAFSILTNSTQRSQYDGQRKAPLSYATLPLDPPVQPQPANNNSSQKQAETRDKKAVVSAEAIQINVAPEMRPAFTRLSAGKDTVERRRCERFKLTVPVLIAGYECSGGKWQEVTKTIDVSRIGVSLRTRKRVRHGLVVHITLPLPTKLRSHGFSEAGATICTPSSGVSSRSLKGCESSASNLSAAALQPITCTNPGQRFARRSGTAPSDARSRARNARRRSRWITLMRQCNASRVKTV